MDVVSLDEKDIHAGIPLVRRVYFFENVFDLEVAVF